MPVPFEHARRELAKASKALLSLSAAATLAELDEAWKEFIHALERAWNKVHARLKHEKQYHSWIGSKDSTRKRDPLLSYLRNARGADEHALVDVTAIEFRHSPMRNLTLLGEGGGRLRIFDVPQVQEALKEMSTKLGTTPWTDDTLVSVGDETKPRLHAHVARLPVVKNQGVTFNPPAAHLGTSIDPQDIVAIAKLGLSWYERTVGDAEAYFSK